MAIPTITNNSPSNGHIRWGAFTIQYNGVGYSIPTGSTSNRWVWWRYNGGTSVIEAGADIPSNLGDDDLVLFGNKNGIGVRVQSSSYVDGELLVDGSIFAEALAANQISSNHIVTAGLDAGVIKFGTMHGDRIAANTIVASKLAITDLENLAVDMNSSAGRDGTALGNGMSWIQDEVSKEWRLKVVAPTSYSSAVFPGVWQARAGDTFHFDFEGMATAASYAVRMNFTGYDSAGVTTFHDSYVQMESGTRDWTAYSGVVTIPSSTFAGATTTVKAMFKVAQGVAGTGEVQVRNPSIRRRSHGKLIVDGTINADKIASNTINTGHITTAGLDAQVIKFGEMSGDRLAANSVLAQKLDVVTIADNSLTNGDFTLLDPIDATLPAYFARGGWAGNASPASNTVFVDSTAGSFETGVRSVKLTTLVAGNSGSPSVRSAAAVPVYPGETWTISARVKASESIAGVYVRLINQNGQEVVGPIENRTVGTSWTTLRGTYTLPNGWTSARVFVLKHNSSVNSHLWVDNVQFQKLGTSVRIADGTVNADKIVSNSVNTGHIATVGLDAQVIRFGEMSGDRIVANSLGAGKIVANSITTREINFVPLQPDGVSKNPNFDNWTGAAPEHYAAWSQGPAKETTIVRNGRYAARWNVTTQAAGLNALGTAWPGLSSNEPYVTVTADVRLESGTIGGAGVLVDFGNGAAGRGYVYLDREIPNPSYGKWYHVVAVVPRPSGYTPNTSISGYVMGSYVQLGPQVAKDIIFDYVDIRPSTQDEISSYLAGTWKSPGLTTINGDSITTKTINSSHVVTAGLDAAVIKFGTMHGNRIEANTLSADRIISNTLQSAIVNAGAINGITITGSVFKTAASGKRLEIDGDSVDAWSGGSFDSLPGGMEANQTSETVEYPGSSTTTGTTQSRVNILSPKVGVKQAMITSAVDFSTTDYGSGPELSSALSRIELRADNINLVGGTRISSLTTVNGVLGSGTFKDSVLAAVDAVGVWANLAITGGWTAVTSQQPQYKKDGSGTIWLRGAVSRTTGTSGSVCATLPVGFRPLTSVYGVVRSNAPTDTIALSVAPNGQVVLTYSGFTPTASGLEIAFSPA